MLSLEKALELSKTWKKLSLSGKIRFFCGPRNGFDSPLQGYLTGKLELPADDMIAVNFSGNTVLLSLRDCEIDVVDLADLPESMKLGTHDALETIWQLSFPTGELCLLFVFRPAN